MTNVQPQFDTFHARIKLGRFDEEKTLREKRDIIRNKLRDKLPGVFKAYGETYPAPSSATREVTTSARAQSHSTEPTMTSIRGCTSPSARKPTGTRSY